MKWVFVLGDERSSVIGISLICISSVGFPATFSVKNPKKNSTPHIRPGDPLNKLSHLCICALSFFRSSILVSCWWHLFRFSSSFLGEEYLFTSSIFSSFAFLVVEIFSSLISKLSAVGGIFLFVTSESSVVEGIFSSLNFESSAVEEFFFSSSFESSVVGRGFLSFFYQQFCLQ